MRCHAPPVISASNDFCHRRPRDYRCVHHFHDAPFKPEALRNGEGFNLCNTTPFTVSRIDELESLLEGTYCARATISAIFAFA